MNDEHRGDGGSVDAGQADVAQSDAGAFDAGASGTGPSGTGPSGTGPSDAGLSGTGPSSTEQSDADSGGAKPGGRLTLREQDDAKVAPGVRAAAAWTWRLLVILAGVVVLGLIFRKFLDVVFPLALALLFTALLLPAVDWAARKGVPRLLAVLLSVVTVIIAVILVLWFVVDQLIAGLPDLLREFSSTVEQTRDWLADSRFEINGDALTRLSDSLTEWATKNEGAIAKDALVTVEDLTAGATAALLMIFLLIFFLYDGRNIWGYATRVIPQANRDHVRSAGAAGFRTLETYVRATVLVAFIDAAVIGTGIGIMGIPMALPLTVIIFLGSFIPIVGSIASGTLAVAVALVTHGWVSALIVLGILIFVMQMEGHVLQPFLLGRSVKLHPVAVILAIAAGLILAGIVGGLLAVPIMAFLNTALTHRADAPPLAARLRA